MKKYKFIAIMPIVCGLTLFVPGLVSMIQGLDPLFWSSVNGVVKNAQIAEITVEGSGSRNYCPDIYYTYTLENIEYINNIYSSNPGDNSFCSSDIEKIMLIAAEYQKNNETVVFYKSDNPELSFLVYNSWEMVFTGLFFAVIGCGFFTTAVFIVLEKA